MLNAYLEVVIGLKGANVETLEAIVSVLQMINVLGISRLVGGDWDTDAPELDNWIHAVRGVRVASRSFSAKTALGQMSLKPGSLEAVFEIGLDVLAELFMRCEALLKWPRDRIQTRLVRLGKLLGGHRLIALLNSDQVHALWRAGFIPAAGHGAGISALSGPTVMKLQSIPGTLVGAKRTRSLTSWFATQTGSLYDPIWDATASLIQRCARLLWDAGLARAWAAMQDKLAVRATWNDSRGEPQAAGPHGDQCLSARSPGRRRSVADGMPITPICGMTSPSGGASTEEGATLLEAEITAFDLAVRGSGTAAAPPARPRRRPQAHPARAAAPAAAAAAAAAGAPGHFAARPGSDGTAARRHERRLRRGRRRSGPNGTAPLGGGGTAAACGAGGAGGTLGCAAPAGVCGQLLADRRAGRSEIRDGDQGTSKGGPLLAARLPQSFGCSSLVSLQLGAVGQPAGARAGGPRPGLAAVEHFRARGHLEAGLDPLLRTRGTLVPKVAWWDAAPSEPGGASSSTGRPALGAEGGGRAGAARCGWLFVGSELEHVGRGAWWRRGELLGFLRDTYCGSIGFEAGHLVSHSERRWWQRAAERRPAPWLDPPTSRRRQIIRLLLRASLFTEFLNMKFPTSKFFGLHGIEALIPGLYRLCRRSAGHGVESVELGLAHRGRLSIQSNLLGKPMGLICAEMQENPSDFHVGDVKYHTGFAGILHGAGVEEDPDQLTVRVRITPNPSHLEAVGPVVVGRVRSMQDALGGGEQARKRVVGAVVHGDAALSGLGVPFECMNLAGLDGYETGGTIHVVLNNQVGFTTPPHQGRSTRHPSDIAKAMDVPVLHVNADDVEAVDYVFSLAADWRAEFGRDVVVDLVGYRRYGHNEQDQPDVYAPMSYARVRGHPMVDELYGAKLVQAGAVGEEDIAEMKREVLGEFEAQYAEMTCHRQSGVEWLRDNYSGTVTLWGRKDPFEAPRQPTGVPLETLRRITTACTTPPQGFSLHPTVAQMLEKRRRIVTEGPGVRVDWATAEMLAFATILLFRDVWAGNSGTGPWQVDRDRFLAHLNIRLSGQDSARGTFNHRHALIHDMQTGAEWRPLEAMAPGQQARFSVFNSPLSEMAVVAFEYGYSVEDARTLVCWEAQFGDFANNAQVAIDQFIASGEEKWGQGSSLVLLLPHGYDGQGPDHSSARLERFLQLVNDDPDHLPGTSPKDVRDIERAFDVLDKTSAGVISKEEVMDYLSELQKANLTEERTAEEVWAEVASELHGADHERRGIDRAQWRQIMTTWMRRHPRSRPTSSWSTSAPRRSTSTACAGRPTCPTGLRSPSWSWRRSTSSTTPRRPRRSRTLARGSSSARSSWTTTRRPPSTRASATTRGTWPCSGAAPPPWRGRRTCAG
ncbi:unnamed protein product [Prorocentrum cordatum]|uniref:EF-hand domain-containing protein n=1 Tax=Prorocentrum cordatum TaxID=2364126 RepID=A0ABN9T0G2_9DINO|nr:unnamed protein product [Polarella glacialis]